jgi:Flp pilus assembly protein TadD
MRSLRLAAVLCALAAPAFAIDVGPPSGGADLSSARAAIQAGDWGGALGFLAPIVQADPRNADALNLLGFASRHAGHLQNAATYYQAALAVDPNHLGALEYQGELFLMTGDRAGAEANLAKLQSLCGSCEEEADLAAALAGS